MLANIRPSIDITQDAMEQIIEGMLIGQHPHCMKLTMTVLQIQVHDSIVHDDRQCF